MTDNRPYVKLAGGLMSLAALALAARMVTVRANEAARTIHRVTELETARLRAKIEAWDLLNGQQGASLGGVRPAPGRERPGDVGGQAGQGHPPEPGTIRGFRRVIKRLF